MSMELLIEQPRPTRNKVTGRFLKGHVPHNKGKKWSEYMGKRAQKKSAKGWANLDRHRNKNGSRENVGRCCRYNTARHVDKRSGNINTDHRYKGVRWYFEGDPIWVSKISK